MPAQQRTWQAPNTWSNVRPATGAPTLVCDAVLRCPGYPDPWAGTRLAQGGRQEAQVQAVPGPKVNRVGDPVKSLESRANTHSGSRVKTLFDAGSTMSMP
jgi:hypothetical protein